MTENVRGSFMPENDKDASGAKERVKTELGELNQKILKLTEFLYSDKLRETALSEIMIKLLWEQLCAMKKYSEVLQRRISIWDK